MNKDRNRLNHQIIADMQAVPNDQLKALIEEKSDLVPAAALGDQAAKDRIAEIQKIVLPITSRMTRSMFN